MTPLACSSYLCLGTGWNGAERSGTTWKGAKKGGMEWHGEGGGVGNNGVEATYVSREVHTYVQPFHCGRLYGMEKGTVTLGILLHFFLHILDYSGALE